MSLIVRKRTHERLAARIKRKFRIKRKIKGTATTPRLNIFKGTKHFNIQFVDDTADNTLLCVTSLSKELKGKYPMNMEGAKKFGKFVAEKAIKQGIKDVVFDRNGYQYHGVVAEFATAARKEGLKF